MTVLVESPPFNVQRVARRAAAALFLSFFLIALPVSNRAQSVAPASIVKDSSRWYYERALIYAQEDPVKGLITLYRTLETAEARRAELERLVKSKLSPSEKTTLEDIERDAKDRRLKDTPKQTADQLEFQKRLEDSARQKLSPSELAAWDANKVEFNKIRQDLTYANKRPVRAVAALHRALDQAESARKTLEQTIKTRLAEADRKKVSDVERDVNNPLLEGLTARKTAQQALRRQMEILARDYLSVVEYGAWKSLKRERLESSYFLGCLHFQNQRVGDAIVSLERIFDLEETLVASLPSFNGTTSSDKVNVLQFSTNDTLDYIPARLLLARAYQQLNAQNNKAAAHAILLARELKLNDAQTKVALSHLSAYFGKPSKVNKIRPAINAILAAADEALSNPAAYRAATIDKGIHDSLMYTDLAQLLSEGDDSAEDGGKSELQAEIESRRKTEEVLREQIAARDGFAPIAYLSLGEIAEQRGRAAEAKGDATETMANYAAAVQHYETAVLQMRQLDLTPESGDVNLTRLSDLRRKIAVPQSGK